MITKIYYVEDAYSEIFINELEKIAAIIPLFAELLDANKVYIQCQLSNLLYLEEVLASFI